MPSPKRLALFTGSSAGSNPRYAARAAELARHLATAGIGIVYGGASVGVMGVVADAALDAGGEVLGVIPRDMVGREIAHQGLTRLDVVETMHERKARMAELADGFVALPGGSGTLDELFEAWTWQHLGIHADPVCLYDVDGFWAPFLDLVDGMVEGGFLAADRRDSLVVASEPDVLLARLDRWVPPASAWR
jgi:uncharacterized protein (TIGR00730 family)